MGILSSVKDAAQKTSQAISDALEHENTKAALEWTKNAASTAADEAVRLSKEVARSDLVKDAATGAAVGAVVAVPVPIIGPAAGAVVGAGIGVFKNLTKPASSESGKAAPVLLNNTPPKDMCEELLKLDELRQKGILTDSEFQAQKEKTLSKN